MGRIRSRDTKPELIIRRGLHAQGLRFRLHDRALPGTPDLVFAGRKAVVFVHGCFWHGHDCPLGVTPGTRTEFWENKIGANRARDQTNETKLLASGWRVLTVWECALRGRWRPPVEIVLSAAAEFLACSAERLDISAQLATVQDDP
jgi:DNA mismatch endonuclease (patch repair protein)